MPHIYICNIIHYYHFYLILTCQYKCYRYTITSSGTGNRFQLEQGILTWMSSQVSLNLAGYGTGILPLWRRSVCQWEWMQTNGIRACNTCVQNKLSKWQYNIKQRHSKLHIKDQVFYVTFPLQVYTKTEYFCTNCFWTLSQKHANTLDWRDKWPLF